MIILMVAAFLKTCPNCPSVGHSFVEFLRYYSQDFSNSRMIIDRGELIVLLPTECIKTTDLVVLDPFRTGINAARTLTKFIDIKVLFGETYDRIMDMVKRHEAGEDVSHIIDAAYGANIN